MPFQSETRLPHLLAPICYHGEAEYQQEWQSALRESWHIVGTTAELSRDGDFLTCTLADTPVQIRNFGGQIRAISNVCAHRHALICSSPCGNSPSMKCQYHGWEYRADGSTGKIPQPKNFVPIDRDQLQLPTFQLSTVGQLVFVNLAPNPIPIRQFLGESVTQLLESRFGNDWCLSLRWQPEYPANWKIPIENSLESYHVPAVHADTFREDPGAARTEHFLETSHTWMATQLPFSPHSRLDAVFQRAESRFVRWLGVEPTGSYQQHHVFPNLLFSFTDAISLVNCVVPTGPQKCVATVRQFARVPKGTGSIKKWSARIWGRLTAAITKKILLEDRSIFEAIQCGLRHSPHPGVLGICEERIHRFQQHLTQKTHPSQPGADTDD